MYIEKQIRGAGLLLTFAIFSGCSSTTMPDSVEKNSNASIVIHNPEIYATNPPLNDDDGNPMPLTSKTSAMVSKEPFPWAIGTSRVAD
jgi:hypothetical protein